ncbi:MAG: hypothetical protein JO154_26335 [Chitinophaga sp.]|uniref:hypothetical protein n=1 Tax=Chitinophaga sp. TaxID=1869181 RepID=UPI0025BB1DFC|nr:hypothetical protein [Chitinophaga sp.]MBV8256141.1 hypothetical protein [Chitinophaga sp.]
MQFTRILYVLCFLLSCTQVQAQTDTISPAHIPLDTRYLKPGMRQYLVYFQKKGQEKQLFWMNIWQREVKTIMIDNTPVFETVQHWYSEDSTRYHEILSINSIADFQPLYHLQTVGNNTKVYLWSDTDIKGDTVSVNKAKDFQLTFDMPNYNWNLDLETFEMLPLAADKTFLIRFYDAGLEAPKYVTYKVIGTETIQTLDHQSVACWKLFTAGESPRGKYTQTFWISCKNHECLKEEDIIGDNMRRYKVKLPAFSTPSSEKIIQNPGEKILFYENLRTLYEDFRT